MCNRFPKLVRFWTLGEENSGCTGKDGHREALMWPQQRHKERRARLSLWHHMIRVLFQRAVVLLQKQSADPIALRRLFRPCRSRERTVVGWTASSSAMSSKERSS